MKYFVNSMTLLTLEITFVLTFVIITICAMFNFFPFCYHFLCWRASNQGLFLVPVWFNVMHLIKIRVLPLLFSISYILCNIIEFYSLQTVRVWQGSESGDFECRHILKDHTAEVINFYAGQGIVNL